MFCDPPVTCSRLVLRAALEVRVCVEEAIAWIKQRVTVGLYYKIRLERNL